MKEPEIVSHFKASFLKKNLRSRIFSYNSSLKIRQA